MQYLTNWIVIEAKSFAYQFCLSAREWYHRWMGVHCYSSLETYHKPTQSASSADMYMRINLTCPSSKSHHSLCQSRLSHPGISCGLHYLDSISNQQSSTCTSIAKSPEEGCIGKVLQEGIVAAECCCLCYAGILPHECRAFQYVCCTSCIHTQNLTKLSSSDVLECSLTMRTILVQKGKKYFNYRSY